MTGQGRQKQNTIWGASATHLTLAGQVDAGAPSPIKERAGRNRMDRQTVSSMDEQVVTAANIDGIRESFPSDQQDELRWVCRWIPKLRADAWSRLLADAPTHYDQIGRASSVKVASNLSSSI